MLDLDRVDLGELCSALEDNSPEHAWWLDPVRGTLELRSEYFDDLEEDEEPSERGLIVIDPLGSHEAYADMEDFATSVLDPRARDLLMRAIELERMDAMGHEILQRGSRSVFLLLGPATRGQPPAR